jgi:hypothetical protein
MIRCYQKTVKTRFLSDASYVADAKRMHNTPLTIAGATEKAAARVLTDAYSACYFPASKDRMSILECHDKLQERRTTSIVLSTLAQLVHCRQLRSCYE